MRRKTAAADASVAPPKRRQVRAPLPPPPHERSATLCPVPCARSLAPSPPLLALPGWQSQAPSTGPHAATRHRPLAPPPQILFDVSGCVRPGEVLALMGPSGSGKTSLLSIMGARSQRQMRVGGEVLFNGQPLTKAVKRHVGYVLQASWRARRGPGGRPASGAPSRAALAPPPRPATQRRPAPLLLPAPAGRPALLVAHRPRDAALRRRPAPIALHVARRARRARGRARGGRRGCDWGQQLRQREDGRALGPRGGAPRGPMQSRGWRAGPAPPPRPRANPPPPTPTQAVVEALGLHNCRDTIIGGFFRKGVSGGAARGRRHTGRRRWGVSLAPPRRAAALAPAPRPCSPAPPPHHHHTHTHTQTHTPPHPTVPLPLRRRAQARQHRPRAADQPLYPDA